MSHIQIQKWTCFCSPFSSILNNGIQPPGIPSRCEQGPQSIRGVSQSEDCLWPVEENIWRRRETISRTLWGRKTRSGKYFQVWGKYWQFQVHSLYESLAIFCTLCTQFSELNTPQGFKSWSKDDWMNKVAEEGRKRQQYRNEENKYSSWINNDGWVWNVCSDQ